MKDPLSLSALFANFGNDLASVDDKKSLLRVIATSLTPKLTISDILLSILNDDRQTHSVVIHHCDRHLMENSDYTQLSMQLIRKAAVPILQLHFTQGIYGLMTRNLN